MKKITLILFSFGLFSSIICAEEEKSFLLTKDPISMKIRKYFEAMKKENIEFAEDFYSEKVKVSINDLDILGKKNYLPRLKTIHKSLFKEVNFDNLHVHTNYFSPEALTSDGKTMGEVNLNEKTIWTNVWGTVTGVGRTTNKKISFRMHMDFRTLDGKVVEMLAFYDPAQMNAEIEALEASKTR